MLPFQSLIAADELTAIVAGLLTFEKQKLAEQMTFINPRPITKNPGIRPSVTKSGNRFCLIRTASEIILSAQLNQAIPTLV